MKLSCAAGTHGPCSVFSSCYLQAGGCGSQAAIYCGIKFCIDSQVVLGGVSRMELEKLCKLQGTSMIGGFLWFCFGSFREPPCLNGSIFWNPNGPKKLALPTQGAISFSKFLVHVVLKLERLSETTCHCVSYMSTPDEYMYAVLLINADICVCFL